ncbi:MAG TPA: DUF371 domain-containing protein [Methanothermococcus okinawensis]|uniref:DUF371 domain-containing protein n=1 Tax=Methanothermococcus okinawensis TaxID=155863 RepID=A0A833E130_9EURY|nr:DUF371 domain-containing protein [Methanococcaceae archaeon]HIP84361.1 DUF371 domain-containing protein [Methanothermococcus okinawensis]HIP91602.1 DUF371 domain-containing protein [Methanothermococcus okinawensis]
MRSFLITAKGHPNVKCTHKTTLEITKEDYLTSTGDCIIGISADKSMLDFPEDFKERIRNASRVVVEILVDGLRDVVVGRGHRDLILNHPTDIVIRRSTYICPRTLMICADKGARDIDREIVRRLRDRSKLTFKITVD